ncbi:putative transmembrane protein [Toxoplasma gondii VAND]|uniref:Putative transmembrane protein n=5 Tax=Toxoplasma gondii TaxID=5811 RepID=B9Q589_TOXGV|nr:putative transmembrane protein [Toxoplasma gondii VEG]KFG52482.1 putative transmembrane protein [Toxoplasma gondii p89]KFH06192.1 putative transmembrane protein [Toxoplasma gondii VAND]PUA87693.1 putative transmembrane protein [Toxoplasma gondii TgCATBr9]RQX75077.1 putative transmembrane protein [Toxoplasma gondii CAST]
MIHTGLDLPPLFSGPSTRMSLMANHVAVTMNLLGISLALTILFFPSLVHGWGSMRNSDNQNRVMSFDRAPLTPRSLRPRSNAAFSFLQSDAEEDDDEEDDGDKKKGHKKAEHEGHKHAAKHHEEPSVQPIVAIATPVPQAGGAQQKPPEDPTEEKFLEKLPAADKEALLHGMIDPSVHFPLLLHMAWKQTLRAIKHLRKATSLLDTTRGHMDGIPRDEKKVPSVSAAVTVDVSGKTISIAEVNKKLRDVLTEAQTVEAYLSSARSQINTQLAKIIPPVKPQQPAGAPAH